MKHYFDLKICKACKGKFPRSKAYFGTKRHNKKKYSDTCRACCAKIWKMNKARAAMNELVDVGECCLCHSRPGEKDMDKHQLDAQKFIRTCRTCIMERWTEVKALWAEELKKHENKKKYYNELPVNANSLLPLGEKVEHKVLQQGEVDICSVKREQPALDKYDYLLQGQ